MAETPFPVRDLLDLARRPPGKLGDDALVRLMTLCMLLHDYCLAEAERRGIVVEEPGEPVCIPYSLPDGLDWPDTVLTRGAPSCPTH